MVGSPRVLTCACGKVQAGRFLGSVWFRQSRVLLSRPQATQVGHYFLNGLIVFETSFTYSERANQKVIQILEELSHEKNYCT